MKSLEAWSEVLHSSGKKPSKIHGVITRYGLKTSTKKHASWNMAVATNFGLKQKRFISQNRVERRR